MIFVTVGTHEQPFNRLIREMDRLVGGGLIADDVFIQRGMGAVVPHNCKSQELISYDDMVRYVRAARIVITHGGPGSIVLPLAEGKKPIVVPRQARYGEHVDDHQFAFARRLALLDRIDVVEDISDLAKALNRHDSERGESRRLTAASDGMVMLAGNLEEYCRSLVARRRSGP